jgi:hypothetical protein
MAQRLEKEGLLKAVTDTSARNASGSMGNVKTKSVRGRELSQKLTRNFLKLWKHRPFSRVVRGYRAYKIVRNYIQLNEKEVLGEIKYQSLRLRGLSMSDWKILWS